MAVEHHCEICGGPLVQNRWTRALDAALLIWRYLGIALSLFLVLKGFNFVVSGKPIEGMFCVLVAIYLRVSE